jgi:hypothetical protein
MGEISRDVERWVAHAMLAAQTGHRHTTFGLSQDRDDLRLSIFTFLHSKSRHVSCRENSTYAAPYFRGDYLITAIDGLHIRPTTVVDAAAPVINSCCIGLSGTGATTENPPRFNVAGRVFFWCSKPATSGISEITET